MERNNYLDIIAYQKGGAIEHGITLRNPTMTMHGWRWDGAALTHSARGAPTLRFSPDITEAINLAVQQVVPQRSEKRYAFQLTEEEVRRDGWEYGGVENDAHGVYYRTTPGVGKTVAFGKADVIEGV